MTKQGYGAGWADGWAGRAAASSEQDYDAGYWAGEGEWTAFEKAEAQRDE